jgi:hypothetical protein
LIVVDFFSVSWLNQDQNSIQSSWFSSVLHDALALMQLFIFKDPIKAEKFHFVTINLPNLSPTKNLLSQFYTLESKTFLISEELFSYASNRNDFFWIAT